MIKRVFVVLALASASATAASAANVTAQVGVVGLPVSKIYSETGMPDFDPSVKTSLTNANGTAWASADLESGTLRGYASTLGLFTGASFNAGFQDTFTFNIAGASSNTPTRLHLQIDFEGATYSDYGINFLTDIGNNQSVSRSSVTFNHASFRHFSSNPLGVIDRQVGYSFRDDIYAKGALSYVLPFDVFGASPVISISSSVHNTGSFNGFADFANSAHLRFVLPQGVTFTSESGVGLTRVANVPEPASWAMMICGFGLIGAASRRRVPPQITYA